MNPQNLPTIGIIGVGKLGLSLTRILRRAGYPVIGMSLDPMDEFRELGGTVVQSARDIGAQADITIECLGSEPAATALLPQYLEGSTAGKAYISLSTYHPEFKEAEGKTLKQHGIDYIDATISGGPARLDKGESIIYVGSDDPAIIERCAPLLSVITRQWHHSGTVGSAAKLKLVNNALGFVHNVATAEALALAEKMGLDPERVIPLLAGGTGSSTSLLVRGPLMARRDYDPPSGDMAGAVLVLDTILDFAQQHGAKMTLLDQAGSFYRRALEQGLHKRDIAEVYEMICPKTPEKPA